MLVLETGSPSASSSNIRGLAGSQISATTACAKRRGKVRAEQRRGDEKVGAMTNFALLELRGFVAAKPASTAPIKKPEVSKSGSLTMGLQARPAYSIPKRPRPMADTRTDCYCASKRMRIFQRRRREADHGYKSGVVSRACMRLQNTAGSVTLSRAHNAPKRTYQACVGSRHCSYQRYPTRLNEETILFFVSCSLLVCVQNEHFKLINCICADVQDRPFRHCFSGSFAASSSSGWASPPVSQPRAPVVPTYLYIHGAVGTIGIVYGSGNLEESKTGSPITGFCTCARPHMIHSIQFAGCRKLIVLVTIGEQPGAQPVSCRGSATC